mgnify:CR=1 FL=1
MSNNSFVKSLLTYISGNTLAQIIPILISPVLTRIYSPDEFASLALFISVCSILAVFANFKYSSAIVLANSAKVSKNLISLSIVITCITFCITFIFLILTNQNIKAFFESSIMEYWYLIPITVLFISINEVFIFYCTSKNQFKNISLYLILRSSITAGGNLLLFPFFNNNLILSHFLGFTLLGVYYLYKLSSLGIHQVSKKDLLFVARTYSDFPRNKLPQNFFDVLGTNAAIFIIGYYFGSYELGLYALLFRVMLVPVKFIGVAVGQVIFYELSKLNKGSYDKIMLTIITILIASLIPYSLIYFYSVDMFSIVFGSQWGGAGEYAKIMIPYFMFYLPASALSFVPTALRKLKLGFQFSFIGNILTLIIYIVGSQFLELKEIFSLISIILTCYFMFNIIVYLNLIKINVASLGR